MQACQLKIDTQNHKQTQVKIFWPIKHTHIHTRAHTHTHTHTHTQAHTHTRARTHTAAAGTREHHWNRCCAASWNAAKQMLYSDSTVQSSGYVSPFERSGLITGRRRPKLCSGSDEISEDDNLGEQFQIYPPNIWGGNFAPYEQNNLPKLQLHTSCGEHSCHR